MKPNICKIVSDGTYQGTKVLMPDGTPIPNITRIEWGISATGENWARVEMCIAGMEALQELISPPKKWIKK